MSRVINVLVFPAGEVNSVELHDALSTCVNIKLFGGSSVDRHGPYIFKNYIGSIPLISSNAFIQEFNEILKKYEIDVVFPTHDTIAVFLSENQEAIVAKVISGSKETAAICSDKEKTYELFRDCSFIPEEYSQLSGVKFPAFIKPKIGAGSVGARKIDNDQDLKDIDFGENIVCEYLSGVEYTVDCLTDREGKLKVVSPRSRDRMMAGISVSGRTQPISDEIQEIAETLNDRLDFIGLWYFQIKQNEEGKFKLLEISVRCAGAMCLTRARGLNLPLLSVYVAMGYDVEATPNNYSVVMDRTLISRYKIDYNYDNVYIDFDDTLIIEGRVNLLAIMFIYQCHNSGKNIFLITRHEYDIVKTLKASGIDKDLFTEIIHLTVDGKKAEKITSGSAIFIDNAYQERKLVQEAHAIPVFDVEGIEVLIDWRT